MLRNIFLIFIILSLLACVPSLDDYYYISLKDVVGIKIVEEGASRSGKTFFHKPMPIKYELDRPYYKIYFKLNLSGFGRSIFIRASDKNNISLEIKGIVPIGSCSNFSEKIGTNNYTYNPKLKQITYGWINYPHCLAGSNMDKKFRVISFYLFDDSGKKIGEEEIPFEFIRNGKIITYDSA